MVARGSLEIRDTRCDSLSHQRHGARCGSLALLQICPLLSLVVLRSCRDRAHICPLLSPLGVLARNPRGILHKILPANHTVSYKLRHDMQI